MARRDDMSLALDSCRDDWDVVAVRYQRDEQVVLRNHVPERLVTNHVKRDGCGV